MPCCKNKQTNKTLTQISNNLPPKKRHLYIVLISSLVFAMFSIKYKKVMTIKTKKILQYINVIITLSKKRKIVCLSCRQIGIQQKSSLPQDLRYILAQHLWLLLVQLMKNDYSVNFRGVQRESVLMTQGSNGFLQWVPRFEYIPGRSISVFCHCL